MRFIDMHCDSVWTMFMKDPDIADLYDSKVTSVDFKRMKKAGQLAQFFAVCLMPEGCESELGIEPIPWCYFIRLLREYLLRNVLEHQDIIEMAYNGDDILRNMNNGKMSAILSMEDGAAVGGDLDTLKTYYDMGYRALTLTWNYENCFGAPNSRYPVIMKRGLTPFGLEAVQYMQELGVLVDVSHLSEGGFYDVARVCKKPFAATHSNAIALGPHQRNLTDDQIRVLGETGSVTGLNFGPEFLNSDITCTRSTVSLIAKHARYMANVGGVECVGIGGDLDGIEGELEISDCTKTQLLEEALKKEGFSENDIEKIFYKNVLRVIQDAMK